MQQRGRQQRPPTRRLLDSDAQRGQVRSYKAMETDYDDVGSSSRMPRSTRRYQNHTDVYNMEEPVQHEGQPVVSDRMYYYPSMSGTRSQIPPRRTATQTRLPALQTRPQPVTRPERRTEERYIQPAHRLEPSVMPTTQRRRAHWLLYVGMGMLVMVLTWILGVQITNWWQVTQDDWHYGRPRTYQVNAVVGHHDSASNPSHFIALNLNGHIQVIEFPGSDSSQAKIYVGPTLLGSGQDLAIITLTFKDVNKDGKPDMIVNVGSNHFVYLNAHGQFVAEKS